MSGAGCRGDPAGAETAAGASVCAAMRRALGHRAARLGAARGPSCRRGGRGGAPGAVVGNGGRALPAESKYGRARERVGPAGNRGPAGRLGAGMGIAVPCGGAGGAGGGIAMIPPRLYLPMGRGRGERGASPRIGAGCRRAARMARRRPRAGLSGPAAGLHGAPPAGLPLLPPFPKAKIGLAAPASACRGRRTRM